MHPNLLPLMLFCFVTSCTPGPNNILASYSSFNFGALELSPARCPLKLIGRP